VRRVHRSAGFTERAQLLYPPGGSEDGRASFELFEERPLAAVELLFSRAFDDQPEAIEGTGIRFVCTHDMPFFPAMVFFAVIGVDDDVELVDVVIDEDYFDLIGDDPDD
jgi:hypothetical protein